MRCMAIAETTGERCRRKAVRGFNVCACHTPPAWNPRLGSPVVIPAKQVEALLGPDGDLVVEHLILWVWHKLEEVEQANLGLMAEAERALPLQDQLLRMVVMRRALQLCREATDLLRELDKEDVDTLRRAHRPTGPVVGQRSPAN